MPHRTRKILFVCMGNICRSPTAEGVFRQMIKKEKLDDLIEVDSAGTHGYHVGEAPDARTMSAAGARGYNLSNLRARKIAAQDIDYFDLILAMDKNNLEALMRYTTPTNRQKVRLLTDFSKKFHGSDVPDPYYGLGQGFEIVLDMIEDAASGLIKQLKEGLKIGKPMQNTENKIG